MSALKEGLSPVERAIVYERSGPSFCEECQRQHAPEERQERLRSVLPCSADEMNNILEQRWSCMYGDRSKGSAGARKFWRDMQDFGAQSLRAVDGEVIYVVGSAR